MKLEVDLSPTIEQQLSEVATRVWRDAVKQEVVKQQLPEYMSLGECCEYLNISRSNLSEFIKLGLQVTIINQTKRIKKSDADLFMEENKN